MSWPFWLICSTSSKFGQPSASDRPDWCGTASQSMKVTESICRYVGLVSRAVFFFLLFSYLRTETNYLHVVAIGVFGLFFFLSWKGGVIQVGVAKHLKDFRTKLMLSLRKSFLVVGGLVRSLFLSCLSHLETFSIRHSSRCWWRPTVVAVEKIIPSSYEFTTAG